MVFIFRSADEQKSLQERGVEQHVRSQRNLKPGWRETLMEHCCIYTYNLSHGQARRLLENKNKWMDEHKNLILSLKHEGGGITLMLDCFAASGPGQLVIIDGTTSSK